MKLSLIVVLTIFIYSNAFAYQDVGALIVSEKINSDDKIKFQFERDLEAIRLSQQYRANPNIEVQFFHADPFDTDINDRNKILNFKNESEYIKWGLDKFDSSTVNSIAASHLISSSEGSVESVLNSSSVGKALKTAGEFSLSVIRDVEAILGNSKDGYTYNDIKSSLEIIQNASKDPNLKAYLKMPEIYNNISKSAEARQLRAIDELEIANEKAAELTQNINNINSKLESLSKEVFNLSEQQKAYFEYQRQREAALNKYKSEMQELQEQASAISNVGQFLSYSSNRDIQNLGVILQSGAKVFQDFSAIQIAIDNGLSVSNFATFNAYMGAANIVMALSQSGKNNGLEKALQDLFKAIETLDNNMNARFDELNNKLNFEFRNVSNHLAEIKDLTKLSVSKSNQILNNLDFMQRSQRSREEQNFVSENRVFETLDKCNKLVNSNKLLTLSTRIQISTECTKPLLNIIKNISSQNVISPKAVGDLQIAKDFDLSKNEELLREMSITNPYGRLNLYSYFILNNLKLNFDRCKQTEINQIKQLEGHSLTKEEVDSRIREVSLNLEKSVCKNLPYVQFKDFLSQNISYANMKVFNQSFDLLLMSAQNSSLDNSLYSEIKNVIHYSELNSNSSLYELLQLKNIQNKFVSFMNKFGSRYLVDYLVKRVTRNTENFLLELKKHYFNERFFVNLDPILGDESYINSNITSINPTEKTLSQESLIFNELNRMIKIQNDEYNFLIEKDKSKRANSYIELSRLYIGNVNNRKQVEISFTNGSFTSNYNKFADLLWPPLKGPPAAINARFKLLNSHDKAHESYIKLVISKIYSLFPELNGKLSIEYKGFLPDYVQIPKDLLGKDCGNSITQCSLNKHNSSVLANNFKVNNRKGFTNGVYLKFEIKRSNVENGSSSFNPVEFIINPEYYFLADGSDSGVERVIAEDQMFFIDRSSDHIKNEVLAALKIIAYNARADYISKLKVLLDLSQQSNQQTSLDKKCESSSFPFEDNLASMNSKYCELVKDNMRSYELIYDLLLTLHPEKVFDIASGAKNYQNFLILQKLMTNPSLYPQNIEQLSNIFNSKRAKYPRGGNKYLKDRAKSVVNELSNINLKSVTNIFNSLFKSNKNPESKE